MKKILLILLCCFTVVGCFPEKKGNIEPQWKIDAQERFQVEQKALKSSDPVHQWKLEAEKKSKTTKDGNKPLTASKIIKNVIISDERLFMTVGKTKPLKFLDCCIQYNEVLKQSVPINIKVKTKYIEHDFNGDGRKDFLVKIEHRSLCKDNLCPSYLFINQQDKIYKKYDGPKINALESVVYDPVAKEDELGSLIFKRGMAHCEWQWSKNIKQDYRCFVENNAQDTNIHKPD
jgi:hypothetical protein